MPRHRLLTERQTACFPKGPGSIRVGFVLMVLCVTQALGLPAAHEKTYQLSACQLVSR